MSKASHKRTGGDKDSAAKNTFNPPTGSGDVRVPGSQTPGPQERDPKRRRGQFSETGNAPLIKK